MEAQGLNTKTDLPFEVKAGGGKHTQVVQYVINLLNPNV